MPTPNDQLAAKRGQEAVPQQGTYKCPVNLSYPAQAQAKSTVTPFGSVKSR